MKTGNQFSLQCQRTIDAPGPALWFVVADTTLLLADDGGQLVIPRQPLPPVPADALGYSRCIGTYRGLPCMVVEALAEPSALLTPVPLRQAYGHIGETLWLIAGRASQVLRWHQDHRFCGRCGTAMTEELSEMLCRCPECGFFSYPRISPAVIMSVVRDGRILLGRSPRFPQGVYSVLAGFVEAGETLEQAVAREIREEVAIEVSEIRYFGSQPWPFPHSLMVGFSARYLSGEIEIDQHELEDAGWFSPAKLPRMPIGISIAARLIEAFLAEHGDAAAR
ncbi:MAG: NAD(+) diphosphatase [Desulfopila sp.]